MVKPVDPDALMRVLAELQKVKARRAPPGRGGCAGLLVGNGVHSDSSTRRLSPRAGAA
jgi:hypothetical protein